MAHSLGQRYPRVLRSELWIGYVALAGGDDGAPSRNTAETGDEHPGLDVQGRVRPAFTPPRIDPRELATYNKRDLRGTVRDKSPDSGPAVMRPTGDKSASEKARTGENPVPTV